MDVDGTKWTFALRLHQDCEATTKTRVGHVPSVPSSAPKARELWWEQNLYQTIMNELLWIMNYWFHPK